MYTDEDLLPLSALQHLIFCERQCALIHVEKLWVENRLTAEGRILHDKVHEAGRDVRGAVKTARGLRIRSLALGLIGQADVVEFHRQTDGATTPYPVEFKRGRAKADRCDEVQLCAQAMCLEEMLGTTVPCGAIFYGQPRRRAEVEFSNDLRQETTEMSKRLHELVEREITPPAVYDKKCAACSLLGLCRPKEAGGGGSVETYIRRMIKA
ncbi:MAG TPA: CRISPR-associated protein Cas4 [Kiritimatiellia bacterium]|nr:CRISPR-associated protein Cas4 [Kiritimatiellia bacterium]